eukprot:IDg18813t1
MKYLQSPTKWLLLLATFYSAQLGASTALNITQRGFLYCPCSATGSEFTPKAKDLLERGTVLARVELYREDAVDKVPFVPIVNSLGKTMVQCIKSYGIEACVNADAVNRGVFCTRDDSGASLIRVERNSSALQVAPPCSSKMEVKPNPSKDLQLSPSVAPSISTPEDPEQPVAGPRVVSTPGLPSPSVVQPQKPTSATEGCVAVEHLHGYVLQHRQNLRRSVLCARGFCATPNHALIVRGRWTSMRRLCAEEWTCTASIRLVNNLKVSANTRAVVNDEIT